MTAGPASALSSSACRTIYGNAPNHGLIDNLPPDSVVEVPCLTDALGVQPTRVGALPRNARSSTAPTTPKPSARRYDARATTSSACRTDLANPLGYGGC